MGKAMSFDDIAKYIYKKEGVNNPTEEQIAARAKALREAYGKDSKHPKVDKNGNVKAGSKFAVRVSIDVKTKGIADNLIKAAEDFWGTDTDLLTEALGQIRSPEDFAKVDKMLKGYVDKNCAHYRTSKNQTNIELLIAAEENHASARNYYAILIKNGVMTNEQVADLLVRELMYEITGDTENGYNRGNNYTRKNEIKKLMLMVPNRKVRTMIEDKIADSPRIIGTTEYNKKHKNDGKKIIQFYDCKIKRNGDLDHGSTLRAYLRNDHWNEDEIDKYDLLWVESNVYDHEHDQDIRNPLISRGLKYRTEEMDNALTRAVDLTDEQDYENIMKAAEELNQDEGNVDIQLNGKPIDANPLQRLLYARSLNSDGTIDNERYEYLNTCLYKSEKPAEIQVQEIITRLNKGDFSNVFESMNPKFYSVLSNEISKGHVKDV